MIDDEKIEVLGPGDEGRCDLCLGSRPVRRICVNCRDRLIDEFLVKPYLDKRLIEALINVGLWKPHPTDRPQDN
jgi:hypothetical protein